MKNWIILSLSLFALVYGIQAQSSCTSEVDVAFIMDSSGSMTYSDFNKEKTFVKDAARELGVAPDQSRAAVILFSVNAEVKIDFGQTPTLEGFQKAVDELNHQYGLHTRIDKALKLTAEKVFPAKATGGWRRIVLLLTDGKQDHGGAADAIDLGAVSRPLREAGVRLIAVGITKDANRAELVNITASEEDVIMARDFNDLRDKLINITRRACGISVCPSREIQATQGQVTSPNFPRPYPSDSDCTLTIDGGDSVKFKIKFEFFQVQQDDENPNLCNYDVLKIIDGPRTYRYCGRGIPSEYTSTGNQITIAFKSDSSNELSGFNISFSTFRVQTEKPNGSDICPSREINVKPDSPDTMKGALYSPNSPNFYPNDQSCTLTLDVPDNYKTVVWFQKFSLQYSPTCAFDKLVVSDEIDGDTQLCGGRANQLPPPMEMKGRKVKFAFTTDDTISAAGFQLKYNITRLQEGRCVCTIGLGYVTIDSYKPKNNRKQDDIRFEFKSSQSSGMIMYAKGYYKDYIYIGYKDSRVFMYHIELGTGEKKLQTANLKLNDNNWHRVHLTRLDRSLTMNIDDGQASLSGQTPGGYNRLDIPTATAYFLGAPTNQNLLPNFIGCIRDFTVDGYEPITNAWARKPDYSVVGRNSMRKCSSSDE